MVEELHEKNWTIKSEQKNLDKSSQKDGDLKKGTFWIHLSNLALRIFYKLPDLKTNNISNAFCRY